MKLFSVKGQIRQIHSKQKSIQQVLGKDRQITNSHTFQQFHSIASACVLLVDSPQSEMWHLKIDRIDRKNVQHGATGWAKYGETNKMKPFSSWGAKMDLWPCPPQAWSCLCPQGGWQWISLQFSCPHWFVDSFSNENGFKKKGAKMQTSFVMS